jgi:hypothetical protein
MEEEQGEFVLHWRAWTIWALPIVATVYFVWLLALYLNYVKTEAITYSTWTNLGLVIFAIVIVCELLLLWRRQPTRVASTTPEESGEVSIQPYAPYNAQAAAVAPRMATDAEVRATAEQYKGKRVIEVSLPPKSMNKGGIYAKAFIDIEPDMVVRIESLVASREDVAPTASASLA